MVDPIIKRIILDPPAPLPHKALRVASVLGFFAYVGSLAYAKLVGDFP
jgi:hypothetical protein